MGNLPSKKIRDIRGERFGRLIVKSFSHISEDKGRNANWLCKCDCGNITTVSSASLRTGSTKSCGCYAKEKSRELIKKTHVKGKHLYFVQSGPYVKIGRADNISTRLSQLKAMNPHEVKLLRVIYDGGHLEHEYHERYKTKHHSGEWFNIGNIQDG